MKHKRLYIIFSIIIIVFSCSLVSMSMQNDTFSAIKIGNYILDNGIDFVEHFNINPNLFYHNARWLFNIIMALIYNGSGFFGIYCFTMVFFGFSGIVIFNLLQKLKNNIIVSFFVTILILFLSYNYILPRAQTISYLLFFVEIYSIDKLLETNNKKYILLILLSSILVANIHTTVWPVIIILFLPYFGEYIYSKIFKKSKKIYYTKINIKLLTTTFLITFASGLLTPLSFTPYTYMFKTMEGISKLFIVELQPFYTIFDSSFILFIILFIVLFIKSKIKASDLFMMIGLSVMAMLCIRNTPFVYFSGAIIISRIITVLTSKYEDKMEIIINRFNKSKYFQIILVIIFTIISTVYFINNSRDELVIKEKFPVNASTYIVENLDVENIRLFNNFTEGAYLEFRGIKVFLDSRSEIYCEEYNDTTILKDWYDWYKKRISYKELFEKYNFTHAIVNKKSSLYKELLNDSDYKEIYKDDYFLIFEKN